MNTNTAVTDAASLQLESAARIWSGFNAEQARQALRAAGLSDQFANMDIRRMPSDVQKRLICGLDLAGLLTLPQQQAATVKVAQMHLASGRFARITTNHREMSVLLVALIPAGVSQITRKNELMTNHETLQNWLAPLDALSLECDGMSRVVSALLTRDSISHQVCTGRLEIDGVGAISYHWWVEFGDGAICDWRARMWLGEGIAVPHGVFERAPGVRYVARERFVLATNPIVFAVLTGSALDDYTSAPASLTMDEPGLFIGHTLERIEAIMSTPKSELTRPREISNQAVSQSKDFDVRSMVLRGSQCVC